MNNARRTPMPRRRHAPSRTAGAAAVIGAVIAFLMIIALNVGVVLLVVWLVVLVLQHMGVL